MKIVIAVVVSVVTLLLLAIGGAALFYPQAGKSSSGGGEGDAVQIHVVQRGELIETVTAPGKVQPKTKVAISAKVSSRILELPFDEGDSVTKGDPDADPPAPASVLVRLDASDLEALLRSARARHDAQAASIEVEKSRIESQRATMAALAVTLADAERNLSRQIELRATKDVSQSTLDQAQMRRDELAAQKAAAEASLQASERGQAVLQYNLEAAEAEIARAEDDLSYTIISSPIDGVVTKLNAEVGELVITGTMNNPGTVILEVADLSNMLVVAELDEADVDLVHEGQSANIRLLSDQDRVYHGTVEKIALKATDGLTRYFETEILLDTDGRRLYSGLTADAEIHVNDFTDVLTVPSQAVLGVKLDDLPAEVRKDNPLVDPDKTMTTVVYRLIDGKAVVTPVRIGTSDLTDTVIEQGLSEGDRVIIGPYKVLESIKHDQKVHDEEEDEDKDKDKEQKNKLTAEDTENTEESPSE
ncbi:MAG: efflux RND transporter periplasmic adaptor subunit [Phycisphaeraceae bacterium]|nr:efflux RND transporter periplasmic adaptor subunit [Phycisphaeraceae bacterium]